MFSSVWVTEVLGAERLAIAMQTMMTSVSSQADADAARRAALRRFELNEREQKLYQLLHQFSYGAGQPTCVLSLPERSVMTGFSMRVIQRVVKKLEHKGLVTKVQMVLGRGKHQGVEYRVTVVP